MFKSCMLCVVFLLSQIGPSDSLVCSFFFWCYIVTRLRGVKYILGEAGNIDSEWTMFRTTTVDAAARSCDQRIVIASQGGHLRILATRNTVKLQKEAIRGGNKRAVALLAWEVKTWDRAG